MIKPDLLHQMGFKVMDQDLIVRSAQTHALMPMMQFSVAPWRILDEKHFSAVCEAVKIREEFTATILQLARASAGHGEPIVRPMEYLFPHEGYHTINDQFMLGESILVAPFLEPGEGIRTVLIPEGSWKARNGRTIIGPKKLEVSVKINEIPIFVRLQ